MVLIDKASLLMVPSVYEDGTLYNVLPSGNKAPDETGNHNGYDQTRADFTFSRGSNLAATRVNASGLIEKGRENLFTQSNNFSHSDWNVKAGTFTQGVADPDGGNNAWAWEATNTDPYLYQSGKSKSGVSVLSIWVKGVGSTIGKYFEFRIGGTPYYNFVLTGEWQRLEYYVNHSSGGSSVGWEYGNPAVVGDVVHIYQAQYEVGTIATAYMDSGATTATAGVLENTPRIDYSSGAGALLLEPQRTNLIPQSEYFGAWTNDTNTSLTANAIQSPSGFVDAYKLMAGTSVARQGIKFSLTPSGDIVQSVYAKKGEYSVIQITDGRNPNLYANFDLENGVIGSYEDCTPSIEPLKNDWYRCVITYNSTLDINVSRISIAQSTTQSRLVDFAGNGTDGIYIWGAQVESGSHVSSYVPTYGSAATRGADSCSVTGVSDVIGQTEGVVYLDFIAQTSVGQSQSHFWLGAAGNEIGLYGGSSFTFYSSGGVSISGGGFVNGQRYKVAFAYKANDYVAYINGVQVGTDTSASVPSMSAIYLNSYSNGTEIQKKNIKETILFNERLSNTELATLTTL